MTAVKANSMIAAKVDPALKAAFADVARRSGKSESDLLREILGKVLQQNPSPAPLPAGFKQRTGEVKLRLRADELAAVQPLAEADSRSIPAWIIALVRRTALGAPPFNDRELTALNRTIAALGPLGRNLNVLVRHFHQTGRSSPADIDVTRLASVVQEARAEVVALTSSALRRFTPEDEA